MNIRQNQYVLAKSCVFEKGFSLIEIMIVVVIVGILASIAIPSYVDYVKKGKAAEATATLANMRVQIEQFFQDNRTYVGFACTSTGTKYFDYKCTTDPTTYKLEATGKASEKMNNFAYSVDQANAKTSTYDGTSGNCWLTAKGGTC